jgi:hypothetical protein
LAKQAEKHIPAGGSTALRDLGLISLNRSREQFRQLGDIHRNPPRFVVRQG